MIGPALYNYIRIIKSFYTNDHIQYDVNSNFTYCLHICGNCGEMMK